MKDSATDEYSAKCVNCQSPLNLKLQFLTSKNRFEHICFQEFRERSAQSTYLV